MGPESNRRTISTLRSLATDAEELLRRQLDRRAAGGTIQSKPHDDFLQAGEADPGLLARRAVYALLLKSLVLAEVCRRQHVAVPHASSAQGFVEVADRLAESVRLPALQRNTWDDVLLCASPDGQLFDRLTALVTFITEARDDPVGSLYQELVSGPERRALGQFYTPPDLARFMASWAVRSTGDRVLEPGTGTGTFLMAAYRRLRELGADPTVATGHLYGLDVDPLSTLMASLNVLLEAAGSEVNIFTADFLLGPSPFELDFDAVLCNPPYSRHHALPARYKEHIAQVLEDLTRIRISRLSSLYVHFFFRATHVLREGGRLAFITPHEFLDVGYGTSLKRLLTRHFNLKAVIVFPENALVFPGVLTTSCITLAEKGLGEGNEVRFIRATRATATQQLYDAVHAPAGREDGLLVNVVEQRRLEPEDRWSAKLRSAPTRPRPKILVPLRDLAEVHRGIATGANSFFILSRHDVDHWGIEEQFLRPVISGAKILQNFDLTWEDMRRLDTAGRRLWLLYWPRPEPIPAGHRVLDYIRHGEEQGYHQRYLCRHRKLWYTTEARDSAPIIFTYMSRGQPRFVYDRVGVQAVNVFHLIYPRPEVARNTKVLKSLLAFLNSSTGKQLLQERARVYGGGLIKAEPSELLSLPVLDVRRLSDAATRALACLFDDLCDAKRKDERLELGQLSLDHAVEALLRQR